MANKRIIELQERTQLDMNDWLIVDSSTSTRKLSMSTFFAYMTMTSMVFVTELPTEDISTSTIYLLPHTGSSTQWDEYVYRDNEWVIIGTSTIDLSALYQTKAAATVQDNNIHWYGTSSTAAATTAKVATTAAGNLGALAAGQKVSIKFTNANTASDPTLNVDGKGAHAIKAYGTTAPTVWWKAGDVVTFTYDGTNWIMGATQGEIEQINSDLAGIKATTYDDSTALTQGNALEVGHDGYLYVKSATSSNPGVIKIEIKDPTHTHALGNVCFRESPSSAEEATVYIKKGLYIYANTIGGNSTAYFRSLKV